MREVSLVDPAGLQVMMRNHRERAGYFFSFFPAETVKKPTNI
ncbi:hypothetical protein ABU178_05715 [Pantoea osteomyelitidis]|uniref:Uncharacterized protein n=1 Tax=Pantoea osteomyelitidis TaxID=3230026 RepID=A0ABW7PTQ3_9GAMM